MPEIIAWKLIMLVGYVMSGDPLPQHIVHTEIFDNVSGNVISQWCWMEYGESVVCHSVSKGLNHDNYYGTNNVSVSWVENGTSYEMDAIDVWEDGSFWMQRHPDNGGQVGVTIDGCIDKSMGCGGNGGESYNIHLGDRLYSLGVTEDYGLEMQHWGEASEKHQEAFWE